MPLPAAFVPSVALLLGWFLLGLMLLNLFDRFLDLLSILLDILGCLVYLVLQTFDTLRFTLFGFQGTMTLTDSSSVIRTGKISLFLTLITGQKPVLYEGSRLVSQRDPAATCSPMPSPA